MFFDLATPAWTDASSTQSSTKNLCRSLHPPQQQHGCLERCWGEQNYKLGLHHEATPETRQQLISCIFGVWLVFFGRTMKKLTLTTIGTVAAVLAFSTGCSQSKIDALNTQLDDVRTALDDAEVAQSVAEREMNVAQDQSETAYANLHNVQRQLAEQKKRADQLAEELAHHRLEIERASAENQRLRVITLNQPAQEKHIAQLEAASKALNTRYDLKVAEYETFVAKTAQALAAKDKRISELSAPVK